MTEAPLGAAPIDTVPPTSSPEESLSSQDSERLIEDSVTDCSCCCPAAGFLSARRWDQLFALMIGILEVYLSCDNALSHGSFSIDGVADFVFASSAVMEVVGLGVMLLIAVILTGGYGFKTDDSQKNLEGFGAPLPILANGVRQDNKLLRVTALLGVASQAMVACACGLVLLLHLNSTAFIFGFLLFLVVSTAIVLFVWGNICIWRTAHHNNGGDTTAKDNNNGSIHHVDGIDQSSSSSQNFNIGIGSSSIVGFGRMDVSRGLGYLFVLWPLGIDLYEIGLLLTGTFSWKSVILAVLDIIAFIVTFVIVCPWGYGEVMGALPHAWGQVRDVFRLFYDGVPFSTLSDAGS